MPCCANCATGIQILVHRRNRSYWRDMDHIQCLNCNTSGGATFGVWNGEDAIVMTDDYGNITGLASGEWQWDEM